MDIEEQKTLTKVLFIWANNEEISHKIIDFWFLETVCDRLNMFTEEYIKVMTKTVCPYVGTDIIEKLLNIDVETLLYNDRDSMLKIWNEKIGFCDECNAPIFIGVNNTDTNNKFQCISCEKEEKENNCL